MKTLFDLDSLEIKWDEPCVEAVEAVEASSVIKSISFDEQEIIRNILDIHCSTPIELDPTYSKGNFYKKGLQKPRLRFDLRIQAPDVVQADVRHLPLADDSLSTIMFDPHFYQAQGHLWALIMVAIRLLIVLGGSQVRRHYTHFTTQPFVSCIGF